jgi:hypothetical protein
MSAVEWGLSGTAPDWNAITIAPGVTRRRPAFRCGKWDDARRAARDLGAGKMAAGTIFAGYLLRGFYPLRG